MIFASTNTHTNDPLPYEDQRGGRSSTFPTFGGWPARWSPRPEFDQPRAHEGNPVLIAARESWDKGDPFGSAMNWLVAFRDHGYYDKTPDMDNQIEHETRTLVSLRTADGDWDLPRATDEHIAHAERVMDRIVDVCRANGLDY